MQFGEFMSNSENEKWLEGIKHKNIKISEPIEDIDRLFKIILHLAIKQRVSRIPIIFRGQGNASHRLIPSAYRDSGRDKIGKFISKNFNNRFDTGVRFGKIGNKDIPQKDLEKEVLNEVQIEFEFNILKEFICEADRQAIPIPEFTTDLKSKLFCRDEQYFIKDWPPHQLYSILGLAQHIGIPTRFLDWTNDVYAALYFAAYGAYQNKDSEKADNIILWILNIGPYKEKDEISLNIFRPGVLINPPFETIFVPTTYNVNLAAQQGLFIYCKDVRFENYNTAPAHDLVKVISALGEIDTYDDPYLEAIRVPVTEANTILGILDSLGYSSSKYFPGLEGVVQTLEMRGNI
jgi:hypothetical protein